MKRLARAVEAWVWMSIALTITGVIAGSVAFYLCWQVLKYTAWVFGL